MHIIAKMLGRAAEPAWKQALRSAQPVIIEGAKAAAVITLEVAAGTVAIIQGVKIGCKANDLLAKAGERAVPVAAATLAKAKVGGGIVLRTVNSFNPFKGKKAEAEAEAA